MSVVTVVLNGMPQIARAMDSVLAQTWPRLEYIVIDGGSTDGTLEVIRAREARLAHWTSEPDRGISDAFNKGVTRATGTYVALLNSDDWLGPDQLERAIERLEATGADFAFGDLIYHEPDGRPAHRIQGDPDYARHLPGCNPRVNHPTMVVRRRVYEAVGGFDPRYRYAMDYDWLLRVHAAGFRGVHAPTVTGHMTLGGACDRHHLRARAENRRIAIRHGHPRARAWRDYLYRVIKGTGRRLLQRSMPRPLYDRLRRQINASYDYRV